MCQNYKTKILAKYLQITNPAITLKYMFIKQMKYIYIISFVVFVVLLASMLLLLNKKTVFTHTPTPASTLKSSISGKCSADCNSNAELDPINEPEYNIKEVIGNTLLLEQHLTEKRKYCKPCCIKHFLLSYSLLEEAIWMAGSKINEYPKLLESAPFHKTLFEQWHADMESDKNRLAVLDKLRAWRQEMIQHYYFDKK